MRRYSLLLVVIALAVGAGMAAPIASANDGSITASCTGIQFDYSGFPTGGFSDEAYSIDSNASPVLVPAKARRLLEFDGDRHDRDQLCLLAPTLSTRPRLRGIRTQTANETPSPFIQTVTCVPPPVCNPPNVVIPMDHASRRAPRRR